MKTRNFPAKKLKRQIDAGRDMSQPYTESEMSRMEAARDVRTKKRRARV